MNTTKTATTGIATTETSTTETSTTRIAATLRRARAALARRIVRAAMGDDGMSTVEYAVGTIAAAAFGAVLYTVVSGDSIPDALGDIIERALTTSV